MQWHRGGGASENLVACILYIWGLRTALAPQCVCQNEFLEFRVNSAARSACAKKHGCRCELSGLFRCTAHRLGFCIGDMHCSMVKTNAPLWHCNDTYMHSVASSRLAFIFVPQYFEYLFTLTSIRSHRCFLHLSSSRNISNCYFTLA